MSSRVCRVDIGQWAEPDAVREKLFGAAVWQAWLDAGSGATTGRSYLGTGRSRAVLARGPGSLATEIDLATGIEHETNLGLIDYLRRDLATPHAFDVDPQQRPEGGFQLGWLGWFGYELGGVTVGAPVTRDRDTDDARLLFVDRAVEFDHNTRQVFALYRDDDSAWESEVRRAVTTSRDAVTRDPEPELQPSSTTYRFTREIYAALIDECLEQIRAGNAYQLCLTNRIELDFPQQLDPVAIYRRLRDENPTHHGGLLMLGDTSLLSSSPEVFLRVTPSGHVTTKPIKGTRPRSVDPVLDAKLADELRSSDKERAENLMIVDLMRNDLGRVCQTGTVTVEKLLDVESYASVHQLVSTVGGDLSPGLTAADAFDACFPAGSMTGAPKLSAIRILNSLEAGPRGIYSGAFGYLSLDGACDLAMVIRSIVINQAHASIGTGGGITSDSDPADEWKETLVKARPLLRVLGVMEIAT